MVKKQPSKPKSKGKAKSPARPGIKSAKGIRTPAKRVGTKPQKWQAYCAVLKLPHQYSPIHGYLPWPGPVRSSRAEAQTDANTHNRNPGHIALVRQAKLESPPKSKKVG